MNNLTQYAGQSFKGWVKFNDGDEVRCTAFGDILIDSKGNVVVSTWADAWDIPSDDIIEIGTF